MAATKTQDQLAAKLQQIMGPLYAVEAQDAPVCIQVRGRRQSFTVGLPDAEWWLEDIQVRKPFGYTWRIAR